MEKRKKAGRKNTNKNGTAGRPSLLNDSDKNVLQKLETAFSMGCTDKEACVYADISMASLYNYQKQIPKLLERKELLKSKPVLKARLELIKGLENNPELCLKVLERKLPEEFGLRTKFVGDETMPIHFKMIKEMSDEEIEKEVLEIKNRLKENNE